MAEVGREFGQVSFDVDTVAIPVQERSDRQSMAKVVEAWSSRIAGIAQADLARQLDECPTNAPFGQAGAVLGKEETRAGRIAGETIPTDGIALQGALRRRMHRHIARLAELRLTNRQHAV